MTPGFRLLLNRFAMIGFERQLAFMELLGEDHDWNLSPKNATATFGPAHSYPVQFLGTRADETNTWLWAWANKGSGVPAPALEAAKKCKAVGKKRSIGELEVESLDLDNFEFDAHTLALIATSVAELPAYYRFPYKGGALFVGIDAKDLKLPEADVPRMAHVIREVTTRFELDHRIAFNSYIEQRGGKVQGDKINAIARWPDGRELRARFDEAGKLVEVGGAGKVESAGAPA